MNIHPFLLGAGALVGALLVGCGGGANLNAPPVPMQATTSLERASLALTVPQSPSFLARTPPGRLDAMIGPIAGMVGGAFVGAARASSQLSEGDRIVRTFGITDPAIAIGQGLAARLRSTHHMTDAPASAAPAAESVDALAAAAPSADIVLDVRSQVYGINYMTKDQESFFVMNTTWARLIDTRSKTILAEARCIPTQPPPKQPLEQLLADQAQGIKAGLAAYVQPCIEQLAAKMKV